MPFCPSVLSVLGSPVPVFLFLLSSNHHVAFICAASQPEIIQESKHRVAELSAIFSGWDHEPRTTNYEKKGFLSFFIFFIPSVVIIFFFGTIAPVGQ